MLNDARQATSVCTYSLLFGESFGTIISQKLAYLQKDEWQNGKLRCQNSFYLDLTTPQTLVRTLITQRGAENTKDIAS